MKKPDRVKGNPGSGKLICIFAFIIGSAMLTGCTGKKSDNKLEVADNYVVDSVYVQVGKNIVASTFDTLRSSLLMAIGSKGVDGAITFCNEKAYPLTATYADSVVIRRTALRYRNPNNKPDSLELLVFDEMEGLMKSAKIPNAKVVRSTATGEIHFFQPILLQAMCMNCHGTPGKHIQDATLTRIQQLYPEDRAVNFKEGDLRGLWHIIFNVQKEK
jgi:hypothetical protein